MKPMGERALLDSSLQMIDLSHLFLVEKAQGVWTL